MNPALRTRPTAAFTLVELLVSSTIIVLALVFLISTVDQTRRVVNNTTAKASQFQAARVAFESMTRNLSQATLNTYYDIDFDANQNPTGYRRQSDLHFVVDKSTGSNTPGSARILDKGGSASANNSAPGGDLRFPGHCVFFQAPLGLTSQLDTTSSNKKYRSLSNLLSVVGYYVEWNEDTSVPDFVRNNANIPKRFRYRLMQVIQPAELNMVYSNSNYTDTSQVGLGVTTPSPNTDPRDWIQVALGQKALPSSGIPASSALNGATANSARVLAENVIGLIIVPKLSERERTGADKLNDLTGTGCVYDSRPKAAYDNQKRVTADREAARNAGLNGIQKIQAHQLPPILQVTMVAIDEDSAQKLQGQSSTPPDWMGGLFESYTTETAFNEQLGTTRTIAPTSLAARLGNTDGSRPTPRMNYRIFTTDVIMRGSKWSKD